MKKILVAALLLTAPAFAMAQKPGGERRAPLTAQQRAEKQTDKLDAIVSLTPDQRQKISAENLRTTETMQPHVETVRSERKAMRDIGKRRHQAYASILTADQMERLKAAQKSKRANGKMHNGRMVPSRGAELRRDAPNK